MEGGGSSITKFAQNGKSLGPALPRTGYTFYAVKQHDQISGQERKAAATWLVVVFADPVSIPGFVSPGF